MPLSLSIEAFRRIDAIAEIFRTESKLHGYTSIIPGSITSYQDLINYYPDAVGRSVKYTGPDGHIYTVKSDPTHFVTQLASQNKRTGRITQKYAYLTSKLNWRTNDGRTVESLQCGLEIYDSQTVLSEAEVIRVAYRVLEKTGIGPIVIDLGNTAFTESLLRTCGMEDETRDTVRSLVDSKNLPGLESFIESLDLSERQKNALMQLPLLFGNPEEIISEARSLTHDWDEVSGALDRVEALYQVLCDYGFDSSMLQVDLSFTNTYSYYTNAIYKIYTPDSGQVLAAGGRYDNAFGYGLPACGIALYLNEINEVIEMKQIKNTSLYEKDFAILFSGTDRKRAFELSDALRDMGYVVTATESCVDNISLYQSDAEEVLKITDGLLEVVNQRMNTFYRASFEQFIRKVEAQYAPSSIH